MADPGNERFQDNFGRSMRAMSDYIGLGVQIAASFAFFCAARLLGGPAARHFTMALSARRDAGNGRHGAGSHEGAEVGKQKAITAAPSA